MSFFTPRFALVPFFFALTMLATFSGCGSASTTVLVPVLGGNEKVRVDLTPRGPAHANEDGFETTVAGFIPNAPPQRADLAFAFTVKNGQAPRRVSVEDISEDAPVLMVTDEAPALTKNEWRGVVAGIASTDPRIEWLHRMNNEIRIYRFTIIAADGHKVVLNQAANYPSFLKTMISDSLAPKP